MERETNRKDGIVYVLSNLTSRKPPNIAPNWRTTYRLRKAALVAVVRLNSSNQRLSKNFSLQWAEVVQTTLGVNSDEAKDRQNGRISLKLLTRGDLPALSADCESALEVRTNVAIIDLRIFVPEVISVLATLSGADFPIHFAQIPFKDRLLGHASPGSLFRYNTHSSDMANIFESLNKSEIEFVLRLDENKRLDLAQAIYSIPQVRSLYGTQLDAFTAALSSSAHCIQGPPGTGKSYVGVCLVLALDVIRSTAKRNGTPVGPSK